MSSALLEGGGIVLIKLSDPFVAEAAEQPHVNEGVFNEIVAPAAWEKFH